jgi:putative tricarboxylic transport membrane protein
MLTSFLPSFGNQGGWNQMANMSMKKGDILAALVIIFISIFVFYESGRWPIPALLGNPLLIPRGVAVCLLFAAGILLFRALMGKSLMLESRLEGATLRRVLAVAILTGGYVLVLERVGFISTTFLYLLLFGLVLGIRRWFLLIPFAIVVPVIVYLIFDTTLNVPLPPEWFR